MTEANVKVQEAVGTATKRRVKRAFAPTVEVINFIYKYKFFQFYL